MKYPTIVYKLGGTHRAPKGKTYAYQACESLDQFNDLKAKGWCATLAEAMGDKPAEPQEPPQDNEPPTRAEIEAQCDELGIKHDGRNSDETLLAKIAEALK